MILYLLAAVLVVYLIVLVGCIVKCIRMNKKEKNNG